MHRIFFVEERLERFVEHGSILMECIQRMDTSFDSPCGGEGHCGKCKVQIIGKSAPYSEEERQLLHVSELAEGIHLACHFRVEQDLQIKLQPSVNTTQSILKEKPVLYRNGKDVPYNEDRSGFGIGYDVGTTTIAAYLIDYENGTCVGTEGALNPQIRFGADVISRIAYLLKNPQELERSGQLVWEVLQKLLQQLIGQHGIDKGEVRHVSIVGNTCMQHLLLGILPDVLMQTPYMPKVRELVIRKSEEYGMGIHPEGEVILPPCIAGFVGSDTMAVILAEDLDQSKGLKLTIDIGTNGELVLGNEDRLLVSSTAAGPAFEGAQVSYGMRGATGAIDHFSFEDGMVYSVIGNEKPKGICGSGLLDLVACLVEYELVNSRGKLLGLEELSDKAKPYGKHLCKTSSGNAFVVVPASRGITIQFTQEDLSAVQLAKGAIAAGIQTMLKEFGAKEEDVEEVILAGAFGSFMNVKSVCRIGMIPTTLQNKVRVVGNAAGAGACRTLLLSDRKRRFDEILQKCEHVDLASNPNFRRCFAHGLRF